VAARILLKRWNASPLDDARRAANLRALLWLVKKLPAASREEINAALENRYWTLAAAQGSQEWWVRRGSPGSQGQAWLTEAKQLADAGFRNALHTLGHAQAFGLGVSQDSGKAGQYLSRALADISRAGLSSSRIWRNAHVAELGRDASPAAADAVIVELALSLVSRKALSAGDRRFAAAVVPGLKHLMDIGEPAAAAVLGDIYACRLGPPMKREARNAYARAQLDAGWAKVIPQRIATVIDARACTFGLSRRGKP
jgi:TPR repeat protein